MNKSHFYTIILLWALISPLTALFAISQYKPFFKALTVEAAKLNTKSSLNRINAHWKALYAAADTQSPEQMASDFKNTAPEVLFGLSSSDYQIGGHIGQETSFDRWAKLHQKELPGTALNFWNNYKLFIDDVASTGAKMFRLSLSWERIQPNGPNDWNSDAVERYVQIVKYVKDKGMEPLVVFHHYTVPTWFEDLNGKYLGGFTEEKNITHFVTFAEKMYAALAPYATYYSTCNLGYEFKAYRENQLAPGILYYAALYAKQNTISFERLQSLFPYLYKNKTKDNIIEIIADLYIRFGQKDSLILDEKNKALQIKDILGGIKKLQKKHALQVTHQVKANILKAHVEIHQKIHAFYNQNQIGKKPQVGIQTTVHPIYPKNPYNPVDVLVAAIGSWQLNHGFYQFFTNDTYDLVMPGVYLKDKKDNAHKCLDWIGINVYDRSLVHFNLGKRKIIVSKEHGRNTATDKVEAPETIATAVQEVYEKLVNPLAIKTGRTIPIFIAENGIAPAHKNVSQDTQNEQRNRYFRHALCTIKELRKKGYPITVYTPWAAHDNFEWGKPFGSSRYGMFHIEGFGTDTVTSTLKDAENNFYVRFCKKLNV